MSDELKHEAHGAEPDEKLPTAIDLGLERLRRKAELEPAEREPDGFQSLNDLARGGGQNQIDPGATDPANLQAGTIPKGPTEGPAEPKTLEEALLVIRVQEEALQRAEEIFEELKAGAATAERENAALREAKKMPRKAQVIVQVDFLTQRVTSTYGGFACLEAVRDALRSAADGIEEQRRDQRAAERLAQLQKAQQDEALNRKLAQMTGQSGNPTLVHP
jgi:hypothetical protein